MAERVGIYSAKHEVLYHDDGETLGVVVYKVKIPTSGRSTFKVVVTLKASDVVEGQASKEVAPKEIELTVSQANFLSDAIRQALSR